MRKPLVAGNWKMHGNLAEARGLAEGVAAAAAGVSCEVVVCPPALHLPVVLAATSGSRVGVGAQDVSEEGPGACTGELSAEMLVDAGCGYVIIGHSERRARHGESNERVAAKCVRALELQLIPIVCVGETREEREAGQVESVVLGQLDAVLAANASFAPAVVAYEPVWAIGTGLTASPEQAQEVHAMLRARLASHSAALAASTRLLYGGSVKDSNAAELFAMADIDGALVGGASLKAADFANICGSAR